MMKSYKEYPYKLTTIIPKGSAIGSKKRDTIRHSYYSTIEKARGDRDAWLKVNYTSWITDQENKTTLDRVL